MLELFTAKATGSPMKLDRERLLLMRYQINGYDADINELLWQYRGIIQKAFYSVTKSVRRMTDEQREDLASDLLVTALEVIRDFDLDANDRLSQVLPQALRKTALEVSTALSVPRGTLALWFKIWNLGGKDFTVASKLAPSLGMSTETFRSITAALEFAESEWVTTPYSVDQPVPDQATYDLAHKALELLTPAERLVIEHAYGFRGDPKSDGDIAIVTEQARSTVSTLRTRGLVRIRKTLVPQS